jgi:hypothetical protein
VKRRFNNTKRRVYYWGKGEKQFFFFESINERAQEVEKPAAKLASTVGPVTRQAKTSHYQPPDAELLGVSFVRNLNTPTSSLK